LTLFPIDLEVAVIHELPSLSARCRQVKAVDDIVEPYLDELQQVGTRHAAAALGFLDIVAEWGLKDSVGPLHLLLFPQLTAVVGDLLLHPLAVHAGRIVSALDATLLAVAALPFK